MKLFYSPASPFARKVLACAVAREIDSRIELVGVVANQSPAALLAVNPLSKVPALLTDDGVPLYDSPVICEFLDSVGDAPALFPPTAAARLRALKQQAMGDGIMDAAVLRRGESTRPVEAARTAVMARQAEAVQRTLDELERDPPHAALDIGSIAVGCALGYLDFRFGHEDWRGAHPVLATWFATMQALPAFSRTEPRELG
jgi:glutathione S-transferase